MVSNIQSDRWRVNVMSLPASITVEELARLFQLHSSRICIPKLQRYKTYHAWINNFVNEQDANEFVFRNSQLIISNLSIQCVAVEPIENDANSPHQPPMKPTSTSVIPNETIGMESSQYQYQNTHHSSQQQQHRNASETHMPHVQVSTPSFDAGGERPPCHYANRGMCRYGNGECKYRHTRCQNYESCSQSDCRLAHARRSQSSSCLNGIKCFKIDCRYEHPNGWSAFANGVQCTNSVCISNHPPGRKEKCPHGNLCNQNNCEFLHPNMHAEECSWGKNFRKWHCRKTHPIGRTQLCPNEDRCRNKPCGYLHPLKNIDLLKPTDGTPSAAPVRLKVPPQSPNGQSSEIIELSSAECNFLEFFGEKILHTIRQESGINDVKIQDGRLQLVGDSSTITKMKSYVKQALHEQSVTITFIMSKYLELKCKRPLMKRFLQKYRVGNSFLLTSTNFPLNINNAITNKHRIYTHGEGERDIDPSEDEDDSDDSKSDISNTSSNVTTASGKSKHRHDCVQNFIQVTLCSDSEDTLSRAIKELGNYSLINQSWPLTQDEIAFILSQSQKEKTRSQRNTTVHEQCFQIKGCLDDLVRSNASSIVQIFAYYKNGVWHVKVRGFKDYVNNAVSQIKNWLNDNIETEVQLPVSKAMAVFLRTKVSSDIRKLEKNYCITIAIFSPFSRKHLNDEQDHNEHDYLKLTGSSSRIKSAQANVENFLESLFEQEKQFPCHSWDVSKNISQIIRTRLTKMQGSDDCEAIGWIKFYTAAERRDITPKVTLSIVGLTEEAADDVAEQCQNIVEGYVVWKPAADEYRAIVAALLVKKTPPIHEFQQQWDTDLKLDRDTSTVIIIARSKMIAEEIKEALLSLKGEKTTRVNRTSEFIRIQPNIRRFVNQKTRAILDEARSEKISVESKNPHGLTLYGSSEIVTVFKKRINSIINDIQREIITHCLQLSSIESNLMRANTYELTKRIERETNTIIRDVKADTASSTLKVNDNDPSSAMITVVNRRGQTIIIQKGNITKAKNVDAIVNAANGPLYHAGGVDKAIADAAGPALDRECKQLIAKNNGLPIPAGKAVKTTAGNLPFKCVIHAIGPQYTDGNRQERPLLFSSILKSLQLAEDEGYASVALPAVSSKTYGFPLADCTNVVVRAVKQFFADYPQSQMRRVILMDVDDTACNSFAREVVIDHSNAVLDDEDDMVECELSPLTARWCWQDDRDEKIYNDNDIRIIETAFQQHLAASLSAPSKIAADNLKSGSIVNYSIYFLPELKQLLTTNPNALKARFVCGYQERENTCYQRDIVRYPVVVQKQNQAKPVSYQPKPLDLYISQIVILEEYWNITGITDTAVEQAQTAIRAAIQSATITELFSINLNRYITNHQRELIAIATQQSIQISFQEECSQQLSMTLKGFEANLSVAKLKMALYAQDILKMQVENDDELRTPKEWGYQKEECKLVDIPKNDPCFVRIENRIKKTLTGVKVEKIERVQNVRMWNHYVFRRRELKKELRLMPNLQIEMELFHGTRKTLPSEVYNGEYGFDMTFSTSGMWGIGAYFAQNAAYSCDGYAYRLPNGKRQVFLAQVLTGDVHDCPRDTTLRRPPKKNETVNGLRYNSVSGDTGGSKVYIVYENRVAYPTYLITFT